MMFDEAIPTGRKVVRLTACLITSIVKAQRYKADAMKDFVFPFNYLKLETAIKQLNELNPPFEIAKVHLFQWWQEGKIELCFDWKGYWDAQLISVWENSEEYSQLQIEKNELIQNSNNTSGKINLFDGQKLRKLEKIKQSKLNQITQSPDAKRLVVPIYGEINSWWRGDDASPYPSFYVRPYGKNTAFTQRDAPHNCEDCDQSQHHWELLHETLGDYNLVLPEKEAKKIYDLLNPPTSQEETLLPIQEKESSKTVNHLANALKSFLYIQYGADVADNIYRELKNPNSQVRQDFSDKCLKHPEGKALEKHLREILITVAPLIEKTDVTRLDNK
ncbi:hypothetical protein ABLA30_21345 [Xenorhabdus nematophila]|uniref:hypothetical protein n=1 Tax=Xenorhabdus nematophila TaxID=628 RepID=UPI0032B840FF